MRIVCLSDTHCQLEKIKVPKGDILIHSGDLTYRGTYDETVEELDKLASIPIRNKVLVAGNHDWLAYESPDTMRALCEERDIIYLFDSLFTVADIKIYGSPWQPAFHNWAFNLPRGPELERTWARIPNETEILVTHGPPHGLLDHCPNGHVGDEALYERIKSLPNLKLHIFGHIHEGYGVAKYKDLTLVNASTCTGSYRPLNNPIMLKYFHGLVQANERTKT